MLTEQTVLDGVYQVIGEIGRGGAGIVYLAYHLRLRKYVVLKNSRLQRLDMTYLRNETDVLKELHHAALPQVYDFLQLGGQIYTVIDYIDGQDFEQLATEGRRFPEEQTAGFMLELSELLTYLHTHDPPVIHSDIKPGNVMLRQDGTVCLIDFNISVWSGATGIYGLSPEYAAPEQQQLAMEMELGAPVTAKIDGRSDIYSLGATMYYIMTGLTPVEGGLPLSELDTEYSADLTRIVDRCIEPSPEDRYQSAQELSAALRRYLRRGSAFRRRCITQALILGLSGLIVCAGIWCLVYGLQVRRHETFLDQLQAVRSAAASGYEEQVIEQGIRILNEYTDQSDRSPESWLQLLRAVGDSYRETASQAASAAERNRRLDQAAVFYDYAASFALERRLDGATDCMVEWACLLIRRGSLDRLLETADFEAYLDDGQREILETLRQTAAGDVTVPDRLAESGNGAAVEAAQAAYVVLAAAKETDGDYAGMIACLEQADRLGTSETVTEKLAGAYMKAGEALGEPAYYAQAAARYRTIAELPTAGLPVKLGYAAALRASGDLEAAAAWIDTLSEQYGDHFDVLAQAALIYSQLGEGARAAACARRAMALSPESSGTAIWGVLQQIAG